MFAVCADRMAVKSCRFVVQKGSTCFTKLPLPCNSIHANLSIKTKAKNFSSTAILFSRCTELHETCTKLKKKKNTHLFSKCC